MNVMSANLSAPDWEDPLRLTGLLEPEELLIRDSAAAYAQDRLMPRILEANRTGRFDRAIMR